MININTYLFCTLNAILNMNLSYITFITTRTMGMDYGVMFDLIWLCSYLLEIPSLVIDLPNLPHSKIGHFTFSRYLIKKKNLHVMFFFKKRFYMSFPNQYKQLEHNYTISLNILVQYRYMYMNDEDFNKG